MGVITPPKPVKLIAGLLIARHEEILGNLLRRLSEEFGPIEKTSDGYIFDKSDYYKKEMGTPLYRIFISFANLVPPETLPEIKQSTNAIESEFPNDHGGRMANVDPGHLTLQNLVLATTKNYTHRIYLREGIFGDLTLIFQEGAYRPLPWTYPDYRDETARAFFLEVRNIYREQLKGIHP
ncbi:MAG: DUF4416 domain-containing protein [Deltaproteobacteria bacterium]|nr:MAG: DUF4416 domain-containing protein [Deltaproteobacteria bacterium]